MTPDERRHLAEQLKANPLYDEILSGIERDAIEALVYARTEDDRIAAQWRVRSARAFREDCEAALRNNQPRKPAPA